MNSKTKPLVVLLGWLGCKPRTLHRYIQLYQDLGCQVITRILSPSLIIQSANTPISPLPLDIHLLLPHSDRQAATLSPGHNYPTIKNNNNITQVALGILQEITFYQYPYFIIHNFSNGGCFLWEKIRQILLSNSDTSTTVTPDPISTLKASLLGVVFDSSPAAYHGRPDLLDHVMMHIPTGERLLLKLQWKLEQWKNNDQGKLSERTNQRSLDYWNTIKNDPWDIPQLYLYSTNDNLTDSKELEKLILYRRNLIGSDKIQSHRFLDSAHCSHLLLYPSEYKAATQSFLEFCINTSSQKQGYRDDRPIRSKL